MTRSRTSAAEAPQEVILRGCMNVRMTRSRTSATEALQEVPPKRVRECAHDPRMCMTRSRTSAAEAPQEVILRGCMNVRMTRSRTSATEVLQEVPPKMVCECAHDP
ncbi:hypothetical protein NDU88_000743 [Pleurodeles waltl]|uniref:Uncharacterized protein n=1 Tax=Pleurodeles waltl TaxID=8319 RepID=A0AAV7R873_PLEWA|nr:hypothetical protein NDU88_000743 [Pleurodeles waltl]